MLGMIYAFAQKMGREKKKYFLLSEISEQIEHTEMKLND